MKLIHQKLIGHWQLHSWAKKVIIDLFRNVNLINSIKLCCKNKLQKLPGMVLMIIDLFTNVKMINYQNLCHPSGKKCVRSWGTRAPPPAAKPITVEENVIWQGRIKAVQSLTSTWHIYNYTHHTTNHNTEQLSTNSGPALSSGHWQILVRTFT